MNTRVLALVGLAACGGSWADADTSASVDAVRAQLAIESIVGPDATCPSPQQVRALARMALCANTSMLVRHGALAPDGGIACSPP